MRYVSPSDVIEPYSSSIAPPPSPPDRIGVQRGSSIAKRPGKKENRGQILWCERSKGTAR